jgi:cobalt/nickel transport system permease protein
MAWIQEKLAFLPDYDFKKPEGEKGGKPEEQKGEGKGESWPEVSAGKSLAGIIGAALTLLMAGAIGLGLRRYYSQSKG